MILRAQIIKLSRHERVTGKVERVGDKCAVARPKIAVMVGRAFGYVRIVGGENRAAVVDLRADDQKRTLVKIDDLRAINRQNPSRFY